MSQLLGNINSIISAFEKYAKKEGDCTTLSKGELKQLIQKEFAEVIVNPHDPETIETVFQLLDTDCDGEVDFEEFTVLAFKVAKACYQKAQECQAPAERQSGKAGRGSRGQDVHPSSGNRTAQSTKKPEEAPNESAQSSSQGAKPEPPTLERCNDAERKPAPTHEKEQSHQTAQRPLAKCPGQREAHTHRTVKRELASQGAHMERQAEEGRTRGAQPGSSPVVRASSHQCPQEPLMPDEEPSEPSPQSTSQPCRTEERGHTDQKRVEEKQTTHPCAHEVEERTTCQRQTQERSTHRSEQECQASEQRSTNWPMQRPQANLSGHQEERVLTSEEYLTQPQEQKPQVGERAARQHQSKPQTQEQGPACKPKDGPQEEQVPPKEAQRPRQTQHCPKDHETVGHHLTGQQGSQLQGPEQTPPSQRQKPQGPQQATSGHDECRASAIEQQQPQQETQKPQEPGQSQFRCHERPPLSPEEDKSPQEEGGREPTCAEPEQQGPRESSARQPFKASWTHQSHKPLQFPTPWSSKQ